MFKNLMKTALRNITNKFGYSLLNIAGMTLAITSSLFLILYVVDEVSYDRYHEKADRIYRVKSHITETDDEFTWIIAQIPFAQQVKADYPEVEAVTRLINNNRTLFKYEDKEYNEERVYSADSTFFDIFTYKPVEGNFDGALDKPYSIVLTKTMASRYFGNEPALGKSLQSGDDLYIVTAVMEDVPKNSHVLFDGLMSVNTFPPQANSWGNFGVFTYILLNENQNPVSFEEKLKDMYVKYMSSIFEPMDIMIEYQLTPIKKIHLYSDSPQEPEPTGSIQYVVIFGIVAFFLILIATLNYINLATARSARRAKEISLRKVVGSGRMELILQFLAESTFLTLISLVLSILLIIALLPKLNLLSGKDFSLDAMISPVFLVSVIGMMVVVGILGGLYPSFYLSRFSPVEVMKGSKTSGNSKGLFRKILTVIQFIISGAMIACTIIVFNQLSFMQKKDQGWNMDNVVSFQLPNNEPLTKMRLFKERISDSPFITHSTLTNTPVGQGSGKVIFNMETPDGMQPRGINFVVVDQDFIETLGIQVIEGREFSSDMPGDTLTGVVINQTLAERLNWEEPLGKRVQLGNGRQIMATVIGVIKDYHQTGMYNEVESLMMLYRHDNPILYAKLNAANSSAALNSLREVWEEVFPGKEFEYEFLSDSFMEQFGTDKNRSTIFLLFTLLIIFIACLGLFGLASYTVERRTREIGVRKVFGASESIILRMITWEFMVLMIISFIIAMPIVIYLMTDWLQNYIYRVDIGPMVFVWTILLTMIPTAITISYQALKAATTNPTEALRVEG